MANIENIIYISKDGKFNVNEDILQTIISKANHCDNLVLITIIGSRASGKSFILNCFHKYLENKDKSNWSNSQIEHGDYFCTDNSMNERIAFIQMSQPLTLETDGQKTAVFLMDATNVFENMAELMNSKLMKDVISFYLFISSTVIFLNNGGEEVTNHIGLFMVILLNSFFTVEPNENDQ